MPNVYTYAGGEGDTRLLRGSRVPKWNLRVEAYGTVDGANVALGATKAILPASQWRRRVHDVQQQLFVLAAELVSDPEGAAILTSKINAEGITGLEHLIDDCLTIMGSQQEFVMPDRDDRSGASRQTRTVVRHVERQVLTLTETRPIHPKLIKYLDHLSDAVYSLARLAETWCGEGIERIVRDAVAKVLGTLSKQTQPDRKERAARVGATPSKPAEPNHEPLDKQSAPAPSRGRTPVRWFDLAAVERIAERAEVRSAELGVPVIIAAADAGGNLILLRCIEGALLMFIEIATNEARDATAFQTPTVTLGPLATGDGPLPGLADTNSGCVVLFGGGVPVRVDGELAGAVGISGRAAEQSVGITTCALQDWNTIGEQ